MDGQHLREDRRRLLSANIESRIATVQQDIWVDYKPSEVVFRMMNNIAKVPRRQNAPALLVTGPGGTGKSAIISQIRRRVVNSDGLIFINMAEDPELAAKKNLRVELAKAFGVPIDRRYLSNSNMDLPSELKEVIQLRKIWGVVIDELHDALLKSKQEQRINMSILKKLLGPEFGLKLFCFGTAAARQALSSNDEFKRRFFEYPLEDWIENEDFRAFLFELEEFIPLKNPSNLYSSEMVRTILAITYGRMDKTIELLRSAACYAIKGGSESIDVESLRQAASGPWSY